MKINTMPLVLFAPFLIACNSSVPKEEKSNAESYTSKEIGWTIEIPTGFKSLSNNRVKVNEQKGKEAIGNATKGETKTTSLVHLINFQKNQFNLLNATITPFEAAHDGDYEKNYQLMKKLIYDAYHSQKIKIDTSSGKELMAKLPFKRFNIKIYGPNGALIMDQIMYSALINGYDFSVNINYNNGTDKKLLLDAFKNSEFARNTN